MERYNTMPKEFKPMTSNRCVPPEEAQRWCKTILQVEHIDSADRLLLNHLCTFNGAIDDSIEILGLDDLLHRIAHLQQLGWLDDDMMPSWPPGFVPEEDHDVA